MDIQTYLKQATRTFTDASVDSARLDCLILLEDALGKDRAWILAHPEYELPDMIIDELNKKVTQRKIHIPLAYIRGQSEFYGKTFYVNEHVLEPRPETETMLTLLLELPLQDTPTIVDVGTGSGVLAISSKLELPAAHVFGIDIDPACLEVSQCNAKTLHADVAWLEGDLLKTATTPTEIDVVLANLPYVPDGFPINTAAEHEPRLAIFGGPDGLELYRQMFDQLQIIKAPYVLTEALYDQHTDLAAIATDAGYKLTKQQDLIQLFELANQTPTNI